MWKLAITLNVVSKGLEFMESGIGDKNCGMWKFSH